MSIILPRILSWWPQRISLSPISMDFRAGQLAAMASSSGSSLTRTLIFFSILLVRKQPRRSKQFWFERP